MVGYFAGPTSVLPDRSGQSDAIGKDCYLGPHLPNIRPLTVRVGSKLPP